jgi:hypothetical protein
MKLRPGVSRGRLTFPEVVEGAEICPDGRNSHEQGEYDELVENGAAS